MAKPTTLGFANFKVYINTGNSPDTFSNPCGFTQKALTLTAASSETTVPDCDDPTAPAWLEREVSALSAQVTGQGVMALESLDAWRDWFETAEVRPVRVEFNATLANNGGYYEGNAILSSLNFNTALNQDGNKVQLGVTIDSAGEWIWHDAAA